MERSTRLAQAAGVEPPDNPPLPPGLVYVTDARPGIRRVRRGKGFAYRTSDGVALRDQQQLARIRRLAIPPAYKSVWICPLANGHLQATGRDARGRKQYRYHALWREQRDEYKFDRLHEFGRALRRIRARVERDLRSATRAHATKLSRNLVLATIVRLLDTTFLRVGNDEYARANDSYGLTTLRNRHAEVRGNVLRLKFRGKSGKLHEASLDDPRITRVVRRCQQMPGQELFEYQDADGSMRDVGSSDVNDYLAEAAGERFTAKDFRTWHGTVQALELMQLACVRQSDNASPRLGPKEVIAEVARRLGNTVAVCKKAYVHPAVLQLGDSIAADTDQEQRTLFTRGAGEKGQVRGLRPAESRLLAFLERAPTDPMLALERAAALAKTKRRKAPRRRAASDA